MPALQDLPFAPGDRLGRARIESVIGQGPRGWVLRAVDVLIDRPLRVEVLRPGVHPDGDGTILFSDWVRTVQRLDHPGIVGLLDAGCLAGHRFACFEWVEGVDLAARLAARGKPSPGESVRLVRACLEALQHGHARGVLHGTLRPGVVLLARDGGVKLADYQHFSTWALQRQRPDLPRPGFMLTPATFFAPEVVLGEPPGPASDLFSLGLVLWECLTGQAALARGSVPASLLATVRGHVPPPGDFTPEVPPALDRLCARLVARDPAERPPSAAAALEELAVAARCAGLDLGP